MKYEIFKDNVKLSRLGLGAMRLPQTEPGFAGPIDEAKAQEIIDYCMAQGVNYYDPASNRIYRLLFVTWNHRLNSRRLRSLRLHSLFPGTEARW